MLKEDYDNYNEEKESALSDFKNEFGNDLEREFIEKNIGKYDEFYKEEIIKNENVIIADINNDFLEKYEDEFNKFCEEQYYEYVDICNTKYN